MIFKLLNCLYREKCSPECDELMCEISPEYSQIWLLGAERIEAGYKLINMCGKRVTLYDTIVDKTNDKITF